MSMHSFPCEPQAAHARRQAGRQGCGVRDVVVPDAAGGGGGGGGGFVAVSCVRSYLNANEQQQHRQHRRSSRSSTDRSRSTGGTEGGGRSVGAKAIVRYRYRTGGGEGASVSGGAAQTEGAAQEGVGGAFCVCIVFAAFLGKS